MRYAINPTNMKLVKDAAWAALPQVGSSHLSEALAAGFGYKTNASLQSALKASTVTVVFDEDAFAGRLRTVAPSVPYEPGLMFPVLASIPEIQTRLKHLTVSKVTAIIDLVEAANHRRGGSGARSLTIGAGGKADAVVDAILRGPSPAVIDLHSAIMALNHDELMELMGLMWIGRDFDGAFEDAVSNAYRNSDAGDVMYIAEKRPVLAKYLRGGLAKIGIHAVSERVSDSVATSAITKRSDACPNLEVFSDLLVDSKIPYEDAVVLWDYVKTTSGNTSGVGNFAVGIMPKDGFADMDYDDVRRTQWRAWMKQWANAHGLPLVNGPLRRGGATPEGIIALAIVQNQLHGDDLERATAHLESRIDGFSRRRIRDFVNKLQSKQDGEHEAQGE